MWLQLKYFPAALTNEMGSAGDGGGRCFLPTYGIILLTWAGSDRRKWGSSAQAGCLSPESEWELERASPHRWKASRLIRRHWRVARAELLLLHLTGGCHRPYVSILGEGVGGGGGGCREPDSCVIHQGWFCSVLCRMCRQRWSICRRRPDVTNACSSQGWQIITTQVQGPRVGC